jgi:hypothetical protein
MLDFYNYSLSHLIESVKDIPKKYQEIFADWFRAFNRLLFPNFFSLYIWVNE